MHSPRTQYAIKKEFAERRLSDVMKHLSHERMAVVHEAFESSGGEVDIYEFIEVMRDNLPELHLMYDHEGEFGEDGTVLRMSNQHEPEINLSSIIDDTTRSRATKVAQGVAGKGIYTSQSSYDADVSLVANLCELFWEIDINGDGTLEWDEFVGFIVEKATVHNLKQKASQTTSFHPIQKLENVAKRGTLNNHIGDVRYIDRLDSLLVTEEHSSVVRLYDAADGSELGRMQHSGNVCCAEYAHQVGFNADGDFYYRNYNADGAGSLITAGDNRTMIVWDVAPGSRQYTAMARLPVPHLQTALCWIPQHRMLMSASTAGLVHSWDLSLRSETSARHGHHDIVSDIIHLPDLDNLASAGMDKQVAIWDISTGARRQLLSGHQRGVLSLAFCSDQRLLVSAGLDHEAHVWSPFVPSLLFKLKGHGNSLLSVRSLPDVPQVVTADVDGILKIWDLRTFQCMQTFTGDSSLHDMTSMTVCLGNSKKKPKIVVATKYLHYFDESDAFSTCVSHDIPIVAALFNPVSMTILTAAGRTVKIWNALTGRIRQVFADIASSDITVITLDDRKRKFIIGDHSGSIRVFDYNNGAPMKYLGRHKTEVTALVYNSAAKAVLSTSWDRRVLLHDELHPERGTVIREMDPLNGHREDVTCLAYSQSLSLVITGSLDRTVRVWDYETGKVESLLQQDVGATVILLLSPWPLLVVATSAGTITLWGLRGSKYRDQQLFRWEHMRGKDDSYAGNCEPTAVLCMDWSPEHQRLYTGDEYGTVRCYCLKNLLQLLDDNTVECKKQPRNNKVVKSNECLDGSTGTSKNRSRQSITHLKNNTPSPAPFIEAEVVAVPVWSCDVHEDTITSLQFVPEHELLLSGSVDCRVKILSASDGSELGTLVQGLSSKGPLLSPHWDVPYDVERLQEEELSFARMVVDTERRRTELGSPKSRSSKTDGPSRKSIRKSKAKPRIHLNHQSSSRTTVVKNIRNQSGIAPDGMSPAHGLPRLTCTSMTSGAPCVVGSPAGRVAHSNVRDLSVVVRDNTRQSILNDMMGSVF